MKEKIFQSLKRAYSSLGLGDEVLSLHADSLNALGLVTDENLDAVISAQRGFLEGLQRNNDKRVTDATRKVTDELNTKHAEELKKKKQEAEAKRKADEEARKKAEEEAARKKAEEEAAEAARKAAEEEARKKAEELSKVKDVEEMKKVIEEMQKKQNELINANKGFSTSSEQQKVAFESQLKAQKEALEKMFEEKMSAITTNNKTLQEQLDKMTKERDAAEAAKKAQERANFITAKAKELGIPQSRIEEGFAIKDDADETAITEYLGKVANNAKVMGLPNKGGFHVKATENNSVEEDVKEAMKSVNI